MSYTLARYFQMSRRLNEGTITANEMKAEWAEMQASEKDILAEFAAMPKAALQKYAGWHYARDKKAAMMHGAWNNLCMGFVPDRTVSWSPLGGGPTWEQAVAAKVELWTDAMISERAAGLRAERDAKTKAWSNPETLDEYKEFIRHHGRVGISEQEKQTLLAMPQEERSRALDARGMAALSAEQRIRWDELNAIATRDAREEKAPEKPAPQVSNEAAPHGSMAITEATHTRDGYKIWVVTLADRLPAEQFKLLRERATANGGYYSSFRGNGAIPGFIFKEQEKAMAFMSPVAQEQAPTQASESTPVESVEKSVADKLRAAGEKVIERAEGELNGPRKTNTARRARMASAIEDRARAEIRAGQTAVSLSAALAEGKLRFLDKIAGFVAPVRVIEQLLQRTYSDYLWDKSKRGVISDSEAMRAREETPTRDQLEEALDVLKYPFPYVDRCQLARLVTVCQTTPGAKLAAARVKRELLDPSQREQVTIASHSDARLVRDLATKAGGNGKYMLMNFDVYDALVRLNIMTGPELRSALREYIPHRAALVQEDPILTAERALHGRRIEGFFPTPISLAREMVEKAGIEPGMRVLEPEAGKGDLCMAVKEACPDVHLEAVEVSSTLHPLLEAKGLNLVHRGDFLEFAPGAVYDRIVMNPPFENGQDVDHVRHAYDLLAPGGRLVAIMAEGPFFRTESRYEQFRTWLQGVEGDAQKNPDGAFAGADAFRTTGVHTRIVVIEKAALRIQADTQTDSRIEVPVEDSVAEVSQESSQVGQMAFQLAV